MTPTATPDFLPITGGTAPAVPRDLFVLSSCGCGCGALFSGFVCDISPEDCLLFVIFGVFSSLIPHTFAHKILSIGPCVMVLFQFGEFLHLSLLFLVLSPPV